MRCLCYAGPPTISVGLRSDFEVQKKAEGSEDDQRSDPADQRLDPAEVPPLRIMWMIMVDSTTFTMERFLITEHCH